MSARSFNAPDRGEIATPASRGGFLARLLNSPSLPALAARLGAGLATLWGRPLRVGRRVVVARHADVTEMLTRDLEFRIAPVNGARVEAANGGPFVLGMDRGAKLAVERAALYEALAEVDLRPIRAAVGDEACGRIAAAGDEIDVVGDFARPIAARTAASLFGVEGPDQPTFMDVARALFAHTFLNLGGDREVEARALRAAALMRDWLAAEIESRRRRDADDLGADMMGALMRQGAIDDDGVRRTLGGMLVGSIDTTATSVAKIVAVIGRDGALAERVAADADNGLRLAGWCREALRRWPHNPILLRRAAADTDLGGTRVREGDQIIAWTQAAMLDPSAFPDPGRLRPDRPAAAYLHLGGGVHSCAGRAVNAFQIPLLVGALVRRGIKSVGPMQWAGPFPDHLALRFERSAA